MSADEIRKLTDLSTPIMPEHWQATVMWPEQWDKIKSALLDYAAMVERCEERIKYLESIRERGDTEVIDIELEDMNCILKGEGK